jgi:hypothetical protein
MILFFQFPLISLINPRLLTSAVQGNTSMVAAAQRSQRHPNPSLVRTLNLALIPLIGFWMLGSDRVPTSRVLD